MGTLGCQVAEILDLLVTPIMDAKGDYMGPMLTWSVVTAKVQGNSAPSG